MADGRRRRWIAVDIDYYAGPLADVIRYRFGPIGLLVFDAYLRACKKNNVEGRITYSCEAEFLSIIGLPGMALVDEAGEEWPLDALWSLLADHKQISRRHRGRLTDVISSRWEQWQKLAIRKPPVGENRRSRGTDTDEIPPNSKVEICSDSDRDSDSDPTSLGAPSQATDANVVALVSTKPTTRKRDELFEAVVDACGMRLDEITEVDRGPTNRAVGALRKVDADPGCVAARAQNYRLHFPEAALTPMALAKHWARCAQPPPPRVRGGDVLTRFAGRDEQ